MTTISNSDDRPANAFQTQSLVLVPIAIVKESSVNIQRPIGKPSRLYYHALRFSLGIIYFHFGFLKFLPGVSPAETLAGDTISALTFGFLDPSTSVSILAFAECGLGLLFLLNFKPRVTYGLFLMHMLGTFSPFFLLPQLTFNQSVLTPTLEGQYILKNIISVVGVSAVYVPALSVARE